jgi:hypothetical protein
LSSHSAVDPVTNPLPEICTSSVAFCGAAEGEAACTVNPAGAFAKRGLNDEAVGVSLASEHPTREIAAKTSEKYRALNTAVMRDPQVTSVKLRLLE